MNALPTPPVPTRDDLPVLLIFVQEASERPKLKEPDGYSLEEILAQLGDWVRVTRVNVRTYPEVTRSFGVGSVPAFVLLSRGKEIWRYDGPIDAGLAQQLLTLQPGGPQTA